MIRQVSGDQAPIPAMASASHAVLCDGSGAWDDGELGEQLVEAGRLTPEEAGHHPAAGIHVSQVRLPVHPA